MAKEERFSFLSTDGKTMIDAVKWFPENGDYHAILQISHGMVVIHFRLPLVSHTVYSLPFSLPAMRQP